MTDSPGPTPIAFCITELDRGGAERALCQLVLGLDRTAWEPRVYCLGPRGYFADLLLAEGIAVKWFDGHGVLSLPRVLVQLTRAFRQFRPAVLQTFLFHGNLVGRIAGRLAGVPKIVAGIRVADRRSPWYGRIDRWTSWFVDHNVCVSQGVLDFSVNVTGLSPRKLSVIPNGVEASQFAQASPADLKSLGIPAGAAVVLTVGRLEQQKGLTFLLQAAATVLKTHPECHFLIAGDGPDRTSLETLANTLGIADSIHLAGPRSDVPELMKAARVFVLPSLWEGMPNALLEAMAAGLPAIATSVEGSSEIIDPDQNGLLVRPADSTELAEAIERLLDEPDTSARLAQSAQLTVEKRFTTLAATHAYDALYRNLISRR